MAASKKADEESLDRTVLANDDLLHLHERRLE
jgi:hypothetical protein